MIQATVCFLLRGDEILLAMKKRGFGAGKWNGPGGKIKDGEDPIGCIIREVKEEIGVDVLPEDFEKVAENSFNFPTKQNWDIFCHVYFVSKWRGEPTESEEMKPQWFRIKDIPYDKMWPDDMYWLDRVLKGEKIKASFIFKDGEGNVEKYEIITVKEF